MMIRLLTIAFLVAAMIGCNPSPKVDSRGFTEIDCPECNGTGKVTYDGTEEFFPAGTYNCPMCGGEGKLWQQ